jgi:hypothetical protein
MAQMSSLKHVVIILLFVFYITVLYILVFYTYLFSDTSENNGLAEAVFHRPALIISKLQNWKN